MGTVALSGQGKVIVHPDIATVYFAVNTSAKKTSDAMRLNNERMTGLMTTLEKYKIDPEDRKTVGFGISPKYKWPVNKKGQSTGKPAKLIGYNCANGVNIKVRQLDDLGDMLADLADAGADCKRKADVYVKTANKSGLDVKLGKILQIDESTGTRWLSGVSGYSGCSGVSGYSGSGSVGTVAAAVPVESGEQEITAKVNIAFELR